MQVFRRNGRRQREAGHLAEGMDSGVGASRALGQGDSPVIRPSAACNSPWMVRFARLHLPAAEIRAVVGQGQLPGLERGLGVFGHGNRYCP